MPLFTALDDVSSISTCGHYFPVVDGMIDTGDISTDVLEGLLFAGCLVVDPAAPDTRSEKQKIRDQLTEAGIEFDARSNVATLQKLLPV